MKRMLKKIILSNKDSDSQPVEGVLSKRVGNIQSIWHNEHQDDVGLEKILRLFLAASQFLFPGIYIKQLFGYKGIGYQELATDLYILIKIAIPFYFLYHQTTPSALLVGMTIWLMLETVLYIATLVFASDLFDRPRSYRRSLLLVFLDYAQIVLAFALLYTTGQHLNQSFQHWFDPIYFSMVTSATVGYGDFHPITPIGKLLATSQIAIFFIVVVLLLNYFSHRIERKGYFNTNQ